MPLLTFADLKASRLPSVLGVCSTSDDFKSYVNEAVQRLIARGHWKGSTQLIRLCVSQSCITLPRQVESLDAVTICNVPYNLRNAWWEFILDGDGFREDSTETSRCPGRNFIDRGWHPTHTDIIPGNKKVRLYHTVAADIGTRVLLQGYDENNIWIRTLDGSTWIDGFYLTLAAPYVESTFNVNSITGVQKPETDGPVTLYEVDADGDQRQLGSYDPTQTVASFRRYQIANLPCDSCCNDTTSVMALAKLAFMPVAVDADYLYVDNYPAIKEMAMAIRLSEMDDPGSQQLAILHERRAIRELQHQQQTLHPDDSTAVAMNVYGSARLNRLNIGRLM